MIPPALWPWRTIAKIAAPVAVVLLAWWAIRSYADRVADGREAEVRAEYKAAEELATAEHNARIANLDEAHHVATQDLQGRLQEALARPPAVRVVRVSSDATCPPPVAADASQPPAADPAGGSTGEGEADYRVLRDAILQLGADAERFRRMALDAIEGWPQ